ncbi:ATP-dependent helicase HrpB [Paenibacillus sp. SORGH_AS306]|uniref:ATP-dependent helicase HrpB n=1 Tax=unclassified Paenibacillus TaxID=185978 RepID=UPI002785A7DB|nr:MULTISPECIES: ATP-dependent helicase HrpB [unclassified Paenibacillus]MDQ1233805.1 ATP-dependent helicase HrpB [Paenibacillus sp. SORGH_AS_0306]MDR6110850.1 ATP-dependent helicase HrpB [Paenibacillus sp. SORGH_AS_0338]
MTELLNLPVDALIPDLKIYLEQQGVAVVTAEPGAGKTTRIPIALLHEPWLQGKRIIMLEPRRVAAISAARFMAASLGEQVGETVGYRVALDNKVSQNTVIEVVTEGILTAMLQHDPSLEQIGLIIFDEFHERNLHADLGLALTIESRSILREDLRVIVMSATMDPKPVAHLLGDAPILSSVGRTYPVHTYYIQGESIFKMYQRPYSDWAKKVANIIQEALQQHEGDILVFLPGIREIRAVQRECRSSIDLINNSTELLILHGGMTASEQDQVILPSAKKMRKVVLATSLAESSITITGIRIVIDSGLTRIPVFSARTGMEHLATERVSQDSADQRRGRAGRTEAGICYRLWSEEEQSYLATTRSPEIVQSDLTSMALHIAVWGTDINELSWLDQPPQAAYEQACQLLIDLEALDEQKGITAHGRELSKLRVHPRLAHMIVHAIPLGMVQQACDLAALLQERDLLSFHEAGADMEHRVQALQGDSSYQVDPRAIQRIKEWSRRFEQQSRLIQGYDTPSSIDPDLSTSNTGMLLSLAYPDRIAKNRGNGTFLLRIGRGASFASSAHRSDYLTTASYIVAAQLDDTGTDSVIRLAAEVNESQLRRIHAHHIQSVHQVDYDEERESISARIDTYLGAILLQSVSDPKPSAEQIQLAIMHAIRYKGLNSLNWTKAAIQWRERISFMHQLDTNYPAMDDSTLLAEMDEWLLPYIEGIRRFNELKKINLAELLLHRLSWEQRQAIDRLAPTHIEVPSGSRIAVNYTDPKRPFIAVRLQELFGCMTTPMIGHHIPLTIHLLSPAGRPVQVTNDLISFWQHAYFDIKKDLKSRYPKHYWPDNPLTAEPTHRAKPRQS